jgi:hypothetical protein
MKVVLKRKYNPKVTLSRSTVIDDGGSVIFEFVTLELPNLGNKRMVSCIPEGLYDVVLNKNEAHKKKFGIHWDVLNVPGRDGVKIHCGNFTKDTHGCILPGRAFVDINGDGVLDINYTRETRDKLYEILPLVFKLQIEELV